MRMSDAWREAQKRDEVAKHDYSLPEPTKDGWPLKHKCGWCEESDLYGDKGGDWIIIDHAGNKAFMCGRCMDEVEWHGEEQAG